MKKLTDKELQIMEVLWENGALSTRDIILHLPDTTAHFNTIATYVRRLEQHGMINHEELSPRFYLYHAAVIVCTVHAGHVIGLVVGATCEMFVRVLDGEVNRARDESLGINTIRF